MRGCGSSTIKAQCMLPLWSSCSGCTALHIPHPLSWSYKGFARRALKRNLADSAHVAEMVASMKRLNRTAAQVAQAVGGIKAATDITGFGMLGHGMEMAQASGSKLVFEFNQIPLLDGAATYAAQFIFPGGASNNKTFFEKEVAFAPTLLNEQQWLLWDPQTSGGLLLAIPAERWADFQRICAERNQPVWVIGQVVAGSGIEVLP